MFGIQTVTICLRAWEIFTVECVEKKNVLIYFYRRVCVQTFFFFFERELRKKKNERHNINKRFNSNSILDETIETIRIVQMTDSVIPTSTLNVYLLSLKFIRTFQ